jgi:hypothetical protein
MTDPLIDGVFGVRITDFWVSHQPPGVLDICATETLALAQDECAQTSIPPWRFYVEPGCGFTSCPRSPSAGFSL